MRRGSTAAVFAAMALVVAACSGGGSKSNAPAQAGAGKDIAKQCPVGAIAKAPQKPVQITMWHSMTRANEETLTTLTNRFNAAQGEVRVRLVNQTSYDDTLTKYKAALGGGELPDLVQIRDTDLQLMIDSQSVLPAEACVQAQKYDMSDYVTRVVDNYRVKGTLWPVPFNASNRVLYYDKAAFQRAGLDPEKPPATLDEVRAAAQKIVSSGTAKFGISLKLDSGYFDNWMALGGQPFVDNGNGREGRATKVTFDDPIGRGIFEWMAGMKRDGLADLTSKTGFDNLLAIGNGNSAMTIETSAALGTIAQVLGSGQYAGVRLGVGPMPKPKSDAPGGSPVGGGSLYIVKKSPPERQEAAWRFATFLNEPQQQAEWAAGTGYIPIRRSAVDLPVLKQRWDQQPGFRVAYDQIVNGANNQASSGPVIGDFVAVRQAVETSIEAMFRQNLAPDVALRQAADGANKAIKDYESRVGG